MEHSRRDCLDHNFHHFRFLGTQNFSLSWSGFISPGRISTTENSSPERTTRSEEHTSELQSHVNLVCRRLLGKKKRARGGRNYRQRRHLVLRYWDAAVSC